MTKTSELNQAARRLAVQQRPTSITVLSKLLHVLFPDAQRERRRRAAAAALKQLGRK